MNPIDEAEIKRFLRSEVDQAALVAASDFHNIDDVVTIRELRAEVLTLRERVAFLESPEVCTAAHDNVTDCGYCQRDRLLVRLRAEERVWLDANHGLLTANDQLRARVSGLSEALGILEFHEGSGAPEFPGAHPTIRVNAEDFATVLAAVRAALNGGGSQHE